MEPSTRPETSVAGRLLATLLSQNTLVQPEVALTRAAWFLLNLPGASNALDALVERSGIEPESGGYWLTEEHGPDGGRTDLEYHWGKSSRTRVIVEAKVGHTLDLAQVDAYRGRLAVGDGLLVVLLPATRRREGERVVAELREKYELSRDSVRVDLWTWDEVASALENAMKGQPDVEQLRGLIEAAKALDIVPFDEHELTTANDSRFDDLWEVLDRASYKLFDITLPAQRDGIFVVWRYVAVGAFDAFFTVGIGRRERTDAEPWIWVKILNDSHLGRASQEVAKRLKPDAVVDEDGLAFPLLLEPGYSGVELEESIRDQLEKIAIQIRDGISESLSKAGDGAGRSELPYSLTGMPAFAAEDLLDSSRQRRDDIVALVREAGRGFVTGRFRMQRSEPFESRFWIQVDPYKTHLSVGVGRTDESTVPRPWAWISVHESTPNRDVAYKALEERFQGEVKGIPNGRGLPLRIPDGVSAGDAFSSVVMQIETAKLAIRAALKAMEA